ncbi:hypothetical protein Tco_0305273 [Tanacetum coccineum]|uniref:Reverse transcriptase domain-containing protein n=1 Tax=Tanacetum coccineum TaxID=301880 RepID=A0ABQ4Y9A5_9ASTR
MKGMSGDCRMIHGKHRMLQNQRTMARGYWNWHELMGQVIQYPLRKDKLKNKEGYGNAKYINNQKGTGIGSETTVLSVELWDTSKKGLSQEGRTTKAIVVFQAGNDQAPAKGYVVGNAGQYQTKSLRGLLRSKVEFQIDCSKGRRVYAEIDLRLGYHQLRVREEVIRFRLIICFKKEELYASFPNVNFGIPRSFGDVLMQREKILNARPEARKPENIKSEDVGGMLINRMLKFIGSNLEDKSWNHCGWNPVPQWQELVTLLWRFADCDHIRIKFLEVTSERFGYNLDMSTAYHPQTDGQSERTIKLSRLCYVLVRSTLERVGLTIFHWSCSHITIAITLYHGTHHSKPLYGREVCSPVCWTKIGEAQILSPELIQKTTEKSSRSSKGCKRSVIDRRVS